MRHLMKSFQVLIALIVVVLIAQTVVAQDGTTGAVTDDMVNAIAAKLYCPVCENITLDTCGTAACADWRYEVRLQLEQGMTEEQIIEDFVRRFGDRVVGTPLDPALRALSLVTPWLIIAGVLIVTAYVITRRNAATAAQAAAPETGSTGNRYQDMFEQDISGS